MRLLLAAALPLAIVLSSCASGPRPPLEALASAARTVDAGGGRGRDLALAAWNAWLVAGDAERMEALGKRAIAQEPGDPWARLALAEAARRRLDPGAEVDALGALIEGAPGHPLAAVAAGRLVALTQVSPALDDEIDRRADEALTKGGLDPEAAIRLRAAQRYARGERGLDMLAPVVDASGAMDEASIVGPFSPWHALDRKTSFPPEEARPVEARYGSFGGHPLELRTFAFPRGWLSLSPEESSGNVYYALAMANVPSAGRWLVRLTTEKTTGAAVFVDGVRALRRDALGRPQPTTAVAELELSAGRHLVVLRIDRGGGSGEASLELVPADGSPSRVGWRAAVAGDAPAPLPPKLLASRSSSARSMATRLEAEVGVLAGYVAALDSHGVDFEGAKEVLATAIELIPRSPALLSLRADLARFDAGLPEAIAQARAAGDLEAVLERDPRNPRALVIAASLLRRAGRYDDAVEKVDAAEGVAPGASQLALARARISNARGFDVQALEHAREAARRGAGECSAGGMVYELARRAETVALVDASAADFETCVRGRSRRAELLAERGRDDEALELARLLVREDPQNPATNLRLADRLLAKGDATQAAEVVARLETAWPRNAHLPRRRAQLLELAGDLEGARRARERALRLDGSDLSQRRLDASREGSDILAAWDRDGLEVIREFEKAPRSFDTAAVVLFDFAAVEAYADGSMIERIHTISKVLDKSGIDLLGEAIVPSAAEVVRLRTIKSDGRILEPEHIAGKESISLPNLEVGDYVEIEYLHAIPSRGEGLEGWSSSPFFFRTEHLPLLDSIYVVRAEKEAGLELDLHGGARGSEIVDDGRFLTAVMRRRDNAPFHPEPNSPRTDEILPWVQAGSGAGEARFATYLADSLAQSAVESFEVGRWARAIAAERPSSGRDRTKTVRAVYERAMEEIEGSQSSFGRASRILASKGGSRLLLIKAALDSLGIESRFAVVRTFDQAPAPFRFPRAGRWGHMVLAVRPDPDGGLLWLDPGVRWAPFGEVAPIARGAPAFLLPSRGDEAPLATSTPFAADAEQGREVELELRLLPDGSAEGSGVERYLGFDGAWARGGIESMDAEQRHQMIESALARSFRGLVLDDLEVEIGRGSGAPVTLRYRFHVPSILHPLGQGLSALELDFFAARMGRRYLTKSERETALLLRTPERVRSRFDFYLPDGASAVGIPDAGRELGAFGSYTRKVASSPGRVAIEEELRLERGRVLPKDYEEFASWVLAVDRAQAAELILSSASVSDAPVQPPVKEEPETTPEDPEIAVPPER